MYALRKQFQDCVPNVGRVRLSNLANLFARLRCTTPRAAATEVFKRARERSSTSSAQHTQTHTHGVPRRNQLSAEGPLRLRSVLDGLPRASFDIMDESVFLPFRMFKQILSDFVGEGAFSFRNQPHEVLLLATDHIEMAYVVSQTHTFASVTLGDVVLVNQVRTRHCLCHSVRSCKITVEIHPSSNLWGAGLMTVYAMNE